MANSNYHRHGLSYHNGSVFSEEMKSQFRETPSRACPDPVTKNGKHGVFLGIEFLKRLVREIEASGFDGLQICYGLGDLVDVDGLKKQHRPTELIGRFVELENNSTKVIRIGSYYVSVVEPLGLPEPPVAGCPPINCN